MPKTLILKSRRDGWHDSLLLVNALEELAQGKPFAKAAMWLSIAGKAELAREAEADFDKHQPDIAIDLSNKQARVLWKHLIKLSPEAFGRNRMTGAPAVPSAGLLYLMLSDWAEQLGEAMPDVDDVDDEP